MPLMSRVSPKSARPSELVAEPSQVPGGWLEALERSEAQLARGETVPLEPMLDLMRASIARMEAKRAADSQT